MLETLALCVVLAVSDGDTMKLQCADRKTPTTVRLSGIDAPEVKHSGFDKWPDQPFGPEAAANLRAVCPVQSSASLTRRGTDRYGRTLGAVRCGAQYASEAQAAAGMAWVLLPPARSKIPSLVAQAQAAHRGLWSQPNPINPADWRKNHGPTP